MAQFIDMVNSSRVIKFNSYNRSPIYIKDEELRFVDELLDDCIINPAKAGPMMAIAPS